ncbi:MAG: hypothetical protein Q4D36_01510 [Bacteroidales bacterium]|nr:hypothetical protein [Bacteroidales bacterium]
MKTKELFGMLLVAFLAAMGLAACSDDEKNEKVSFRLELPTTSYEIMQDGGGTVGLTAHENTTIEVDDPELIQAKFNWGYYTDSPINAAIILTSKGKKGQTSVFITDHENGETATLSVKVVDNYLPISIDESSHPALTGDISFYLVRNEQRDCYFFMLNHMTHQDVLGCRGTYDFSLEEEDGNLVPYLTLTYVSDAEGRFTVASIPPTAHKFSLAGSSSAVYGLIYQRLGIDWEGIKPEARDYMANMTVIMKEVGTEYEIRGEIDNSMIQQGVLE